MRRIRGLFWVAACAVSAWPAAIAAQGTSSAALEGRVIRADSLPVKGVRVRATLVASGAYWEAVTDASGRYFMENVDAGGPYVVHARSLGYSPAVQRGITTALGQRHRVDFVFHDIPVGLPAVTVLGDVHPLLNSGRAGPQYIISEAEFGAVPNVSRDITHLATLSPLVTARPLGGISIQGQNPGFNALHVDGGVNTDLYLGRSPGGASLSGALPEVLPRMMSIESVRQAQIAPAPFDVRFGRFAGGLLSAVTKSGTNELRGVIFGLVENGDLIARNASGRKPEFTTWQFGANMSGPVKRDRAHFFVNVDFERRAVPDAGPTALDAGRTGVSEASAIRFQRILRDTYGLEAGTLTSDGTLDANDVFAKLSLQLGAAGRLELSQHHATAARIGYMDVGRTFDSTALSSTSAANRSTAITTRLIWNTRLTDRVEGEFIVSHRRLRDTCEPNGAFPLIQVRADAGTLIAGPNSVCPTTAVHQRAVELTGNVTRGAGAHVMTLGAQAELLHFRDPLVQVSAGRWDFLSLDSLERRVASHYDRGIPAPATQRTGVAFDAVGLRGYAQDRWSPTARLTLTGGLSVDATVLPDAAVTNQRLMERGIDTGVLPGRELAWSPRIGINYDVRGDRSAFLRGGIGLFTGPPPYRWIGNAYRDSGDELLVSCDAPRVPAFTPADQPAQCTLPGGTSTRISYFDRDFRFPQQLKAAMGMDQRLSNGAIATVDVVYTHAIHQIEIRQANLQGPVATAAGEGGRVLYGRVDPVTGRLAPSWLDTTAQAREIYLLANARGDHAMSASAQIRRQFGEKLLLQASYSYSIVRDRASLVNFPARANFSNTPVDRTLDDRQLRPSYFETPHRATLLAVLGVTRLTRLSLLYVGASQPPFTYVINGDANADGIGGSGSLKNDIVYVPLNAADITLDNPADHARLDEFIDRHPCLREQRGRIMRRGSCRNGWLGMLNARITTRVPSTVTGLQLTADVVNVPNLLNARWGRQREVTTGPTVTLLLLDRWDAGSERWRYKLPARLPASGMLHDATSRWRIQLGARYDLRQ